MGTGSIRPLAVAGIALATLAGCGSMGSREEGGNVFSNLLMYGGTTVPPVAQVPLVEAADCPPVTVTEGGAAIRTVAGGADASAVRSQLAITEVARECVERPDGGTAVKVGIQVRALLGPGGGAARFDTPVTFVLKRGETVLASRVRRVSIAVPAGQVEQSQVVVESDLVVPPGTGEYDIEVTLGGTGSRAASPPRGQRRSRG